MKKNEKTLSVSEIEETKNVLKGDLDKVQERLNELERMKVQLTSQGNALQGAIQQCDVFLNQLSESSPDSSIPSQDNSAVNTVLS
jgi:FtsZ-binding cell division protein ZapB